MPRAFLVRISSRGLHHDAKLLAEQLVRLGYEILHLTHPFQWHLVGISWSARVDPKPVKGDLVIFIENICPMRDLVQSEARMVLLPNAELLSDVHVQWANTFCDDVWHKCQLSRDVFSSWSFIQQDLPRHVLTGFTSRDMYLPEVPKVWDRFLHMFGTSPAKGTQDLIKLWRKHPEWPTLQLVGRSAGELPAQVAPNIEFRAEVPEEELAEFVNRHGIHVCPSAAEGWGHYIVEAMGCANVVLTTDAPPMHEHIVDGETGFLIPVRLAMPYRDYAKTAIRDDRGNNMARWNAFSPEGFESLMVRVLSKAPAELAAMGRGARVWFEQNHAKFCRDIEFAVRAGAGAGAGDEPFALKKIPQSK